MRFYRENRHQKQHPQKGSSSQNLPRADPSFESPSSPMLGNIACLLVGFVPRKECWIVINPVATHPIPEILSGSFYE